MVGKEGPSRSMVEELKEGNVSESRREERGLEAAAPHGRAGGKTRP